MSRFSMKKVLVTGGTSGIGFAAARRFLAEGARVTITGADAGRLAEAEHALGDVVALAADARDVGATTAAVDEAARRMGGLDIVFLNAGAARFASIETADQALFDDLMAVNARAVLFTAQAAARHLPRGGAIVVNTSVNGRMGMPGTLVYGATKAAARNLVRTLAGELAPRGIRVNAISPGPIETPIYGKLGLSPEQLQGIAQTLAAKIPLGRFGTPDEIAGPALFLASDDASYITGTELVADGGWTDVMS
ncbi:SDR family oxidoreductase [Salinarimonas ramus]|uniref:Short-chain dehydrogenase n=1 Tax=Salinarimonas ramus TaxID=690164 RepID=A0A917V4C0_9HYPH|nr:SDR family oxidoreductase [Salinarimonas ramus]GGK35426.1 short-chain dehydrogenase [Salinarimonas ramus]